MKYLFCALVLLGVLRGISVMSIQLEQERRELEEYARLATRLFNALPDWNVGKKKAHSLGSKEGSRRVETLQPQVEDVELDDLVSRLANKSPGYPSLGDSETFGRIAHHIPFTIEEAGLSSESDGCLRDRHHITAIFHECINKQIEMPSLGKNTTTVEGSQHSYDENFLKYCRKAPQLKECVKNTILVKMEECLDEGMHETIANVEEVTAIIIRFICNREADRISIFIADGGFDCLQSNSGRILGCLSANIATHVLTSLFDIPSLKLTIGTCLHLELAEKCVSQQLARCKNRVLVSIVGVVFNIGREIASCANTTTTNRTLLAQTPSSPPSAEFEIIPGRHVDRHHGDQGKQIMGIASADGSSGYLPSTREPRLSNTSTNPTPVLSHAPNVSSDQASTARILCQTEVIISVLICALIVVSVLAMVALQRLIRIQSRIEKY